MARTFGVLLVMLGCAAAAVAQQPAPTETANHPKEQDVVTDPAEYSAYMAAINTTDLAGRQAALDNFLQRYPNSGVRDRAVDLYAETLVQLDNQRTAPIRQQLRAARLRGEAFARSLAFRPDNLGDYARCGLGQFTVEESSQQDRPFTRTVPTADGDREIEVLHGITLHIAYAGTPFVNFKAEKLGNTFATKKHALLDSLQYLGTEPDMTMTKPWPSAMHGFEVYGINRKQLAGGVVSLYLLFHDSDMTVVTLYLLNTPPDTSKFHTLREYQVLRDQFLQTYTACTGEHLPGHQ